MARQHKDIVVDTVDLLKESLAKKHPTNILSKSINMVPSGLCDLNPSCYNPRVVSIGPLHRDDQNVQAFEDHKASYANGLLRDLNFNRFEEMLNECVDRMVYSIEQIRLAYAGTNIDRYSDIELVKMMVTDACFILKFILTIQECGGKLEPLWRGSSIIYDLVLVENQIPFFVLKEIFNRTILKSQPAASLNDLILYLVQFFNVFETNITSCNNRKSGHFDHILDFLEQCYWPSTGYSTSQGLASSAIHSTVELDRAGVIFKPNRDQRWQTAMEFQSSKSTWPSWCWGKPTLKIPVLRIDNSTEWVLRNLIAYEQYHFGSHTYVTSYAMAMDMLVDTEDDIAKLVESKVIVNHLGSNEKAANAVNSLCKELPVLNFCYANEWQQLDARYNSYWPKNIAALKRSYFSNPWSMIALIAGIALFALTVVQTIYTVNAA